MRSGYDPPMGHIVNVDEASGGLGNSHNPKPKVSQDKRQVCAHFIRGSAEMCSSASKQHYFSRFQDVPSSLPFTSPTNRGSRCQGPSYTAP